MKCQDVTQALLKDKNSELKLNIAAKGSGLQKYATFKNWSIRIRTALENSPVMVEMFDRAISAAMSVNRGQDVDVLCP